MLVYLSVELDAWQHLRKAADKQFSRSGGVLLPWLTREQEAWLRCVWGDDKRSEIWGESWRSNPAAARPSQLVLARFWIKAHVFSMRSLTSITIPNIHQYFFSQVPIS